MAGVYVSHDLAVVAQIADRIVVLRAGEGGRHDCRYSLSC